MMTAGNAWKYTLEDLGCATQPSTEGSGGQQMQSWQSNKKFKKGHGDDHKEEEKAEEDKPRNSNWGGRKSQGSYWNKPEDKDSSSYSKWQDHSWGPRDHYAQAKPYHKSHESDPNKDSRKGDGKGSGGSARSSTWSSRADDQWKKKDEWKSSGWQKDTTWSKCGGKSKGSQNKGGGHSRR